MGSIGWILSAKADTDTVPDKADIATVPDNHSIFQEQKPTMSFQNCTLKKINQSFGSNFLHWTPSTLKGEFDTSVPEDTVCVKKYLFCS